MVISKNVNGLDSLSIGVDIVCFFPFGAGKVEVGRDKDHSFDRDLLM